jgi:transposase
MRSDLTAMTPKEIHRLEVLQRLEGRLIRQADAARELGISIRQVKRAVRAYRQGGAKAVASKHRGRPGNRRRDPLLLREAVELVREHYCDFGPTLASEMLADRHDIHVDRETLRKLLIAAHIWKPKRRIRAYHPPRERRAQFGELVQIDGSPHRWFEERGPRCTLIVFIDDATSRLVGLRFEPAESTNAYFRTAHDYFRRFGLPQSLYSDRHSIFRINSSANTTGDSTDFAKAMDALNIELICANSPQAKGRVERANRTLQDRLIKELRIANVNSIDAGNTFLAAGYLERHNARFAMQPRDSVDAHQSLPVEFDLVGTLARRSERKLTKDLTFSFGRTIYRVLNAERRTVFPHALVQTIVTYDGQFIVERNGQRLAIERVRDREKLAAIVDAKELAHRRSSKRDQPNKAHQPDRNHPWKNRGGFQLQALGTAKGDISNLQVGDISSLR